MAVEKRGIPVNSAADSQFVCGSWQDGFWLCGISGFSQPRKAKAQANDLAVSWAFFRSMAIDAV